MSTLTLPSHAGPVALRFSPDIAEARRDSENGRFVNSLTFPRREGMELHPLLGGSQFLLRYPPENDFLERVIFAGMDESAFLTGIRAEAFHAFKVGGEESFFEALKPNRIKRLSKLFPAAKAVRQGDVWAFPLPFTWDELVARRLITRGKHRREVRRCTHRTSQVLKSNHSLQGLYVRPMNLLFGTTRIIGAELGEGTLTAADHEPRQLSGPHVIVRTPNLVTATREQARLGHEPHYWVPETE